MLAANFPLAIFGLMGHDGGRFLSGHFWDCLDMTAADFPRGLVQPENSYRFGEDALILAALSARLSRCKKPRLVCDLGCGCGAAILGLLLLWPDAEGSGIDLEEELVAAARINAQNLDLDQRTRFVRGDLAARQWRGQFAANSQDLVIANPPWRLPGDGRKAKSDLRENALRSDVLADFCRAAAYLLRGKGFFDLILPAYALTRAIIALEASRLGLRLLQPIQSAKKMNYCERIFLRSQKGASAYPKICAPFEARPQKDGQAMPDASWPERIFAQLPDYSTKAP